MVRVFGRLVLSVHLLNRNVDFWILLWWLFVSESNVSLCITDMLTSLFSNLWYMHVFLLACRATKQSIFWSWQIVLYLFLYIKLAICPSSGIPGLQAIKPAISWFILWVARNCHFVYLNAGLPSDGSSRGRGAVKSGTRLWEIGRRVTLVIKTAR